MLPPFARAAVFLVALAGLTLASGRAVLADEHACTASPGRPACTILRPPPSPPRTVPLLAPECIVTVGGLASDNDDAARDHDTFGSLTAPFASDPRYEVHRFGSLGEHPEAFPYDTDGAISVNGHVLRDFVRDLSGRCSAIDIVTHSMGGVVADRAFSLGLSAADGVATYLPIAAPHNGAMLARTARGLIELDASFAEATHLLATATSLPDLTSTAVRDLALTHAPLPLRDITTVRQRRADDAMVYLPDNWDRRVDVRDRLPDALTDGHGGSLADREIVATSAQVIRSHAVPPDDRSLAYRALAVMVSTAMLFVALRVSGAVSRVVVEGVLLSKAVTLPLGLTLPLVEDAILALLPVARGGLALARTALRVFADVLASAGDLLAAVPGARLASARAAIESALGKLSAP